MHEPASRHYFWQDDGIRLRALQPDDWEAHYTDRFDTPARRFVDGEVELPPTVAEAQAFIEQYRDFQTASGRLMFTIESLSGEHLGGINLNSIDERNGTFGIGLQIDHDRRHQGYGTRAMRIVLRYAFFERRLHKFNTAVMEGNTASARMLEKLGCIEEGVRREVHFADGRYLDAVLYGLTAEEFSRTERRSFGDGLSPS